MSGTQADENSQAQLLLVTGFEPVAAPGELLGAGIVHRSRDQLVLVRGWLSSASPRTDALPAHRRRSPASAA